MFKITIENIIQTRGTWNSEVSIRLNIQPRLSWGSDNLMKLNWD